MPLSTVPGSGASGGPASSAGGAASSLAAGRESPAATPSPKPPRASSSSSASASRASGPVAVASSSSPSRAPSVIRPVRLRALTGAPPPGLARRRSDSWREASSTTSAAGRACRPISLRTGMRASASAATGAACSSSAGASSAPILSASAEKITSFSLKNIVYLTLLLKHLPLLHYARHQSQQVGRLIKFQISLANKRSLSLRAYDFHQS